MHTSMKRLCAAAFLLCYSIAASGRANEPLVGTWKLEHQEINGQEKETEPLTLRISPDGDKYLFAFSVPVNKIDFVSMSYTAKLDGSEADVKNSQGTKVGTVQITETAPLHYKLVLKGVNRPDSNGKLTISTDGKKLTSESDGTQAGRTVHSLQLFLRR